MWKMTWQETEIFRSFKSLNKILINGPSFAIFRYFWLTNNLDQLLESIRADK